jgi:adenine deaminase
VISAGRKVNDQLFETRAEVQPVGYGSVKANPVTPADFTTPGNGRAMAVIGVLPGKIITAHLTMDLPERDGLVQCDPGQDAIKVVVVERHGINGNIGRGFVHGFGLKHGAIGSTVGHDSHNICVVGVSDADMALAVNHLRGIGGGFVVVRDGAVLAELALPIAGLMSDRSFEAVRDALIPLRQAAKSLGTVLAEPFLQVAFLPLPVIPHLKISDRGLVDVDKFCLM